MYTSMYKLLNLTPLTYSSTKATRNYRDIMPAIHPDKCTAPEAADITKAVNVAFKVLTNQESRNYYNLSGKISLWDYDNAQAEKDAAVMKKLLKKRNRDVKAREEEKQYMIREKQRLYTRLQSGEITHGEYESAIKNILPNRSTVQQENENDRSSDPTSSPEDSWSTFLRKCAKMAEEQQSNPSDSSGPKRDEEHPNDHKTSSATDDDSNHTDTKTQQPPVYTIDSDTEDEEGESPVNDENQAPSTATENETLQATSSTKFNDAASSPIKFETEKIFKDVATSPIKFEDEKVTSDAATSPIKHDNTGDQSTPFSKSTSTAENNQNSGARKNLNFDTPSPKQDESADNNTTSPHDESKASTTPGPNTSTNRRTSIHKQYIMQIFGYRMRYLTDGTGVCRFNVRWGQGGHDLIEPADVVLKEKAGLKNWLDWLKVHKPKKYDAIVRYHPEFLGVYE